MAKTEIKFTKQQILQSQQFTHMEKDILTAVLPDREHTIKACIDTLKEFNERVVG